LAKRAVSNPTTPAIDGVPAMRCIQTQYVDLFRHFGYTTSFIAPLDQMFAAGHLENIFHRIYLHF
jgi:hypothetical protein